MKTVEAAYFLFFTAGVLVGLGYSVSIVLLLPALFYHRHFVDQHHD